MIAPTKRLSSLIRGVAITSLWLVAGMAHAGTKHYYYTDPQGTVLAKADEQGAIVSRNDYAPYGSAAPNMDAAPDGPGYTGHVNDPDTGLVYMQARYYDPVVGRFLSEDPVGPAVGNPYNFNRFAYANNNPIVNMDADGRTAILDSQNLIDGPGYSIAGNAPSSNASAKDALASKSQAPPSSASGISNTLTENTVAKPSQTPDGDFYHSIKWKLDLPSEKGGYIVQEVMLFASYKISDKHWWEAFPVGAGADYVTAPTRKGSPFDDVFRFLRPTDQDHGYVIWRASARFYEGLTLPSSFKVGGSVHAGDLRSTTQDPHLPTQNATMPVNRQVPFFW